MNASTVSERRHREIAGLAEAVAATCTVAGRVEPARALCAEGVRVFWGDFHDAFDGLLEARTSGFCAYVDLPRNGGRADAPRARFTLAHEAGHYFIDEHRRALRAGLPPHGSITDFAAYTRVEREADLFAAHLLMPAGPFAAAHRRSRPGLDGVLALADAFGASRTSTALRIAQLDLAPVAALRFRTDGPGWGVVSRSLQGYHLITPYDHIDRVPRGGATDIAARTASAERPVASGTTAAFWFDRVRAGGPRDSILQEEAISLGSHGVVTFLSLIAGTCGSGKTH